MTLIIDSREKNNKLAKALMKKFPYDIAVLGGGDFCIPMKVDKLLLIERMTFTDFLGKIKSGRLKDQIFKMRQLTDNNIIMVENPYMLKYTKWNINSVVSLMADIEIKENLKVVISLDQRWSYGRIAYWYNKFNTDRKVAKYELQAKGKDMSDEEQAIYALSGIAGIGEATAIKLFKYFGSFTKIAIAKRSSLESVINPKVASHLHDVLRYNFKSES